MSCCVGADPPAPPSIRTRRVVVTRAVDQSGTLVARLRAVGIEPVELPVIEIIDPSDGGAALRAAVGRIDEYDWVVVASRNAASRLLRGLSHDGSGRRRLPRRVAAVGPGTAALLAEGGLRVDLVPPRNDAEGLVAEFPDAPTGGPGSGRVLLPRAEAGRMELPDGLASKGWAVDAVVAYRTMPVGADADAKERASAADGIAFTSASTVRAFVAAYGRDALPPVVVSIGPTTTAAAAELGIAVTTTATPSTLDALVDAIVAALPVDR